MWPLIINKLLAFKLYIVLPLCHFTTSCQTVVSSPPCNIHFWSCISVCHSVTTSMCPPQCSPLSSMVPVASLRRGLLSSTDKTTLRWVRHNCFFEAYSILVNYWVCSSLRWVQPLFSHIYILLTINFPTPKDPSIFGIHKRLLDVLYACGAPAQFCLAMSAGKRVVESPWGFRLMEASSIGEEMFILPFWKGGILWS